MPDPELARLYDSLRRLRLTKLQERVETLLQEASQQDLTYAAFLDRCLAEEVASKTERQVAMHTAMARFPYLKTLEAFDFSFQPSIDRKKIQELATGRFIDHAETVILLEPPGTGKTHLAVALALKAVQRGGRVYLFLGDQPADIPDASLCREPFRGQAEVLHPAQAPGHRRDRLRAHRSARRPSLLPAHLAPV